MNRSHLQHLLLAATLTVLSACGGGGGGTEQVAPPAAPSLALLAGSLDRPTSFSTPYGITTDGVGNVYVADTGNHVIRKITPNNEVSTIAGTMGQSGSADGTGSAARFNSPYSVASDSAGNLHVADSNNHTIRRITPAGVVTTVAGTAGQSGAVDASGADARFRRPFGVAVDQAGNVFVADWGNHTIRKVTSAGVVTTLAGTALQAGSTDGSGATALFNQPYGLAADAAGNVWVADTNNFTIRKITAAGVVSTMAGAPGQAGSTDASGAAARLDHPWGVAADAAGSLYVADTTNCVIRKITAAGLVSTLAGTAQACNSVDGTGPAARFNYPRDLSVDAAGNVYVADSDSDLIRKITPAGVVSTLAQAGSVDGTGAAARFDAAVSAATDGAGNVFVVEAGGQTIRKITPAGVVSTLAGMADQSGSSDGSGSAARFSSPWGVATDTAGNVYVADYGNDTIRKITAAGVVTTLAGTAGQTGDTDASGAAARFNTPTGLATDAAGNVYVADQYNHTVRKISPAGVVTTLAGTAGQAGSTDATGAAARFTRPVGIATDAAGNLFVTDFTGHTLRKITPAGVVTTLAGTAGQVGSTDGSGSAARFSNPLGIATDGAGHVYVADAGNSTVRRVTPAGVVSTLVGAPGQARFTLGALPGTIDTPYGVAVSGNSLYIVTPSGVIVLRDLP